MVPVGRSYCSVQLLQWWLVVVGSFCSLEYFATPLSAFSFGTDFKISKVNGNLLHIGGIFLGMTVKGKMNQKER